MDAIEFGRINNNIILGKMYVWWVFWQKLIVIF